jgi:anhydro-N-acetylmuramic acid kinase
MVYTIFCNLANIRFRLYCHNLNSKILLKKNKPNGTFVLGLMSGTSLDGLDMALCEFAEEQGTYRFSIHKSHTLPYSSDWKKKLSAAPALSAEAYFALNAEFGRFMAEKVLYFLSDSDQKPELLASHGHTVFHQPQKGFSAQLGCGATLAALTGISTVCDFRSTDVALGGQGAPLVPIGDKLLFPQYQACINVGGIANISFDNTAGERLAFDICEANLLLNHLSEQVGKSFDENGSMARSGKIDPTLLRALNELDFYKTEGAKSLGREWFESRVLPLFNSSKASVEDKLSTSVEHIAMMIAQTLNKFQIKEALFSGGGAFNVFLMERIQRNTATKCMVADPLIVNFKEALIFAFLAYLRVNQKTNTLHSVTAASRNSISGAVYLGKH